MNNRQYLKKGFVNRKIFHFFVSGSMAIFVWFLPQDKLLPVAIVGLIIIFCGEMIRLKTSALKLVDLAVGDMMKQEEKKSFTSVFWLAIAGLIISTFASPEAISYAFIVLATADPSAAVIGKRFKSKNFYKRKTIIGSFTFFVVAFFVSISYFFLVGIDEFILIKSLVISIVLTFVEIFSPPLDDNFTLLIAATIGIIYLL